MRILIALLAVFTFTAMVAPPKKATIQTNAICGMCKKNIETALNGLDGIEKAELDLVTKKVKVKYDAKVIDLTTIRQAIAATGYDADDIPARPKARAALAACCRDESGDSCKKPE
ncbi:heavy-metal-associated domain-containing protein [Lewinella sp. W8]|uniref:heavy-metal-associated domain-containing protein n=1 Tax=Lewinella sp. W8 TaxID=2528208 RepID=UPI0010675F64|nr:heavy metal-associated domain-containing protein [Lewinella sp. W8]MTB51158.1 MerP protein [Lewinella sp. W8]